MSCPHEAAVRNGEYAFSFFEEVALAVFLDCPRILAANFYFNFLALFCGELLPHVGGCYDPREERDYVEGCF